MDRKFSSLLADIYAIQNHCPYPDFDEVDTLISSCPFSASNHFIKTKRSLFIDELYKSRNVLFRNSEKRSKLLQIGLLKHSLGPKSVEKIQLSLISDTRNSSSDHCLNFLNCCFSIEANDFGDKFALESELLETAVNAWMWVGKESLKHGKLLHRRIKSIISSMLSLSMKDGTVKAACLLSLIEKHPENIVLEICLDLSIEEIDLVQAETCFLNTMLRTDSYRFMGHFLSCVQDMSPRLQNAWELGYIDDSFSILLRQIDSSTEVSKALSTVLASKASKRFIAALANTVNVDLDGIAHLLDLMCTVCDTGSASYADTDLVARELITFLSQTNIKIYGDGAKSLCSLGIKILDHLEAGGKEQDELGKHLRSELFYFLFAALPVLMKKKTSLRPTKIKSDLALMWLLRLVKENPNDILSRKIEPLMYQKVCRVCLKQGITAGNDDENVSMLSLKFIGLLLKLVKNDPSVSPVSPTARDVFEMIVSHSKFELLFADTEMGEGSSDTIISELRENVLKLLISCILISDEDIQIESNVWKAIFSSFNAGISHTDVLIRYLVTISCEDSRPFMDEFHWKGCDMASREQTVTGKLDWLAGDLDTTRIRASISRFPVFDTLDLKISLDDIWKEDFFDRSLEQSESRQPSYAMDTSKRVHQYSPAFLFPLLLKNIESGVSRKKKLPSDEENSSGTRADQSNQEAMSPWDFSKSSIESVQQMCEKGIVSLCLASLSSSCEKVRCYAVSIMGLILQASISNYALEMPSWRDRPQLAMILNSVQRSILLQKALDDSGSIVPRVAPVVATFLARAATVLPRPDDALYVPMNRYFLKTEANHGAFQDMKRLPAFMSLFCSSSEDPDQSRAERMWGLQVLCDGLADASCYKLVTACHAPELILSSFENVRLSKASDEAKGAEICLLLGSLRSMIEHGEYGAHVHLIRRCGLLSWMSSVCSTRSMTTSFPTERSRILFCQLANSVVERVFCTRQLRSFEVIDEVCSLLQPVASLCLIKGQAREPSRSIYEASLTTLRAIAVGLRSMREERIVCPDILPLGVTLESSLHILKFADDSLKAKALHTLCCLPVSLTEDLQQETAKNLIVLMLDYFSNVSNDDENELSSSTTADSDQLIVLLLKRMLLLIEQCEIVLPSKNSISGKLVTKIFALRCQERFSEVNVRRLWSQCLKLLMQKVHTGGLEINSLEETIRKEISKTECY